MKTDTAYHSGALQQKLVAIFQEMQANGGEQDRQHLQDRELAMASFLQHGFPHQKLEDWRSTSLTNTLEQDYLIQTKAPPAPEDISKIFKCDIHHLDTHLISLLNGWFVAQAGFLTTLPGGVIVGSLSAARQAYPELFTKYYSRQACEPGNAMSALNTAFALDGVFIYVPDGVTASKTIQVVNILNATENILIQSRNLIILGKEAKLQLVQCDHSVQHRSSFINAVSEFYLEEGAVLDHYKLQNKDNDTTQVSSLFFRQEAASQLSSTVITLNGGIIRNNLKVVLAGPGADARLFGLYLMDKEQHVDNNIRVDHQAPDCTSRQLFKGIIDDQAMAVFNGLIHVEKDAQRTNAFQNNKNILLTDKATVHAQPHLLIYADDVKCSHGATVGQLDPDAMFYMRSRGIREDTSRMLMMYAFAADIINHIRIQPVRHQIDEMVYRRLRGELSVCDQCIIDCNATRPVFDIDMSKI